MELLEPCQDLFWSWFCVDLADLFPHSMLWHECWLAWRHTYSILLLV
jgi:hypothetical protein